MIWKPTLDLELHLFYFFILFFKPLWDQACAHSHTRLVYFLEIERYLDVISKKHIRSVKFIYIQFLPCLNNLVLMGYGVEIRYLRRKGNHFVWPDNNEDTSFVPYYEIVEKLPVPAVDGRLRYTFRCTFQK